MKPIGIITDSYSGIGQNEAEQMGIMVLPMPFYCGDECYYEGVSLTREHFFEQLASGEKVSTSQPSPEEVLNIWRKGLNRFEQIIYMPLSSGLSGACNTARMLADEGEFKGKVFVVDHGRIATPLRRTIMDGLELIEAGLPAERIKEILEAQRDRMAIYIAVETLEYLKKGGRITAATAAIGTVLSIKPILKVHTGLLETYKKSRGMKKARKEMLEAIRQDLETTFREEYEKGEIHLMIASSADEVTTLGWIEEIQAFFPGMEILGDDLPLGICGHTGPGALGIGISCVPKL